MARSKKLENLEKKFGLAVAQVEQITESVLEIVPDIIEPPLLPAVPCDTSVAVIVEEEPLYQVEQLKSDFQIARANVIKLIATGQRILDSAAVLDIDDMKASQLDALSNLQTSIGGNIKMMMELYKGMSEIEKLRKKTETAPVNSAINNGTVVNNNIAFQGSTLDLLKAIQSSNLLKG